MLQVTDTGHTYVRQYFSLLGKNGEISPSVKKDGNISMYFTTSKLMINLAF